MWIFNSPRVIAFGSDALDELQSLVDQGTKVLIITDKNIEKLFLDKLTTPLKESGFEWKVFSDVEPDPSLETCKRAAAAADEYKPDWFFALGGGSVIDTTKAAFFIYERPDVDISGVLPFDYYGLRKKARGIVTIPTTSGTGAEVTPAMVITVTDTDKEHRKINPTSREIIADMVIVDPVFTANMPPVLTAYTGLDALTHSVEAYVSEWRNDFSDGLCIHSLKMIFEYLPRAVKNGADDMEAREKMHNAATISGLGFGSANVGQAHSLGHALGVTFGMPHGLTVGIFLPRVLEFIANSDPSRIGLLARELGISGSDDATLASEFIKKVINLMHEVNVPPEVKSHVPEDVYMAKIDILTQLAELDTGTISSCRPPTTEEFNKLFIAGYYGHPVDF
ncbi:MAG: iron-containing alcohol dehydrogenase [Candidatus Hodarchaeales archaeon]